MVIKIRPWRPSDAKLLAEALNNKKIHDNLRDGLPLPYTISDAEAFISAALAANKDITFDFSDC